MGTVLQFFRPERAFDAETTAVLIVAYEKAVAGIERKCLPEIMREVAARRIIALASKGERDPDRLCAAALGTIARTNVKPIARSPEYAVVNLSADRVTP
jgi:hypothetical protein